MYVLFLICRFYFLYVRFIYFLYVRFIYFLYVRFISYMYDCCLSLVDIFVLASDTLKTQIEQHRIRRSMQGMRDFLYYL